MPDVATNSTASASIATASVSSRFDLRRMRDIWRTIFPFIVVGGIWEIVALSGIFPRRLFPPLEEVFDTFVQLTLNGILPHHAIETILRLLGGFALAAIVGVLVGILMGRSRRAEDYCAPLVSFIAPIPGIAYAPLFLLWFGLGNLSTVLLVGFVSMFPIIINTWTGVKAVKEIWVRSAHAMGADNQRLFRYVILPGSLPYIFTGLRLLIFGAREFLNTDVMLAGIAAIGIIGLLLENLVFRKLEEYTVVRWGMVTT